MKRWILTLEGFNHQPKIYAESSDKAKEVFKSKKVIGVKPDLDRDYLKLIDIVTSKSKLLATQKIKNNKIREWYQCKISDGTIRFRLYKDLNDDLYFDIAEFQFMSNDSLVYPITFEYSNPQKLYDLFFCPELFCEIPIYRFYGQPKMKKPSELKGVKQSFSVDWIPKQCTCQCFAKDNDLWIKHRDFFSELHKPSPEDNGTPLSYRTKKYFGYDKSYMDRFIYADCWGEIVLRNEAWIVFRNIKQTIIRGKHMPVKSMLKVFSQSDLLTKSHINVEHNEEWYMFLEKVCKKYLECIEKEERKDDE